MDRATSRRPVPGIGGMNAAYKAMMAKIANRINPGRTQEATSIGSERDEARVPAQRSAPGGTEANNQPGSTPQGASKPSGQEAFDDSCPPCDDEDTPEPRRAGSIPSSSAPTERNTQRGRNPAPVAFAGVGVDASTYQDRRKNQTRGSCNSGWSVEWQFPGQAANGPQRKKILHKKSIEAVPTFACPRGKFCTNGTCLAAPTVGALLARPVQQQ